MAKVSEGQFALADISLYTRTWTPDGPITAKLVFVHGFSDHINRYNDFFPKLAEKGIQVFGWDQRGWGRTVTNPAQRGLTGPTSQVLEDMVAFVKDKLPSQSGAPSVPIFVMGHSMGGGEVLTLAGSSQYSELVGQVRGWLLESPFVGFPPGEEPGALKVKLGRLVGRLFPRQQLKHVIPPEYLSRDEAVVQSLRDDPLCHNIGTLEGLASLLDRTEMLSSGKVTLDKQVRGVFLAFGTKDRACYYKAAVEFLQNQHNVGDKTTKLYQGAYHQLHADYCKDEFANDVISWILERSGEKGTATDTLGAKL